MFQHLIVRALKGIANDTATAKNVCGTIKQEMKILTVPVVIKMNKYMDVEAQKKRQKVQEYFWNIVGTVEHINIPKIEDAIRKEFSTSDDRVIKTQIGLMQTEGRIRIQNNVKVWIKKPPNIVSQDSNLKNTSIEN